MKKKTAIAAVAATSALAVIGTGIAAAAPAKQGNASTDASYVVPAAPGVQAKSILTVGDQADNGYMMAGIPDGLGAFDNGDGTFTVLMNHEIGAGLGAKRQHGSNGAFVSKWTISNGLKVLAGEDLIKQVKTFDGTSWVVTPTTMSRLCSADLPAASAFYNAKTGKGSQAHIFMNGEESGADGRAFAHVASGAEEGTSYQLPWMGKASWENIVAMPNSGDKTVVVGLDDSGGGEVYVYVGEKRATGNEVEKAGLVGGKLYGLKIAGVTDESDATDVGAGAAFSLVEIPGAATMTGAQLEAFSAANGISSLARPEDGAWDPSNANGFYFATTASFTGISRLWHLNFADAADVTKGGTAAIAVASPKYDASNLQGPRMMDNITVNDRGNVLLQEDPGGQNYRAGIFEYDPKSGNVARIAQFDENLFTPGAPEFITNDEESSGIIPVPFLGEGKYLFDAQVHTRVGVDPANVERGQLSLLQVAPGKPVN